MLVTSSLLQEIKNKSNRNQARWLLLLENDFGSELNAMKNNDYKSDIEHRFSDMYIAMDKEIYIAFQRINYVELFSGSRPCYVGDSVMLDSKPPFTTAVRQTETKIAWLELQALAARTANGVTRRGRRLVARRKTRTREGKGASADCCAWHAVWY